MIQKISPHPSFPKRGREKAEINPLYYAKTHVLLILFFVILFSGCDSRERAMKELERLGVTYSPIRFARHAISGDNNVVKLFLKAGMDVNTDISGGQTVLHIVAAEANHPETVELLIAKGADVNKRNSSGMTPLRYVRLFLLVYSPDMSLEGEDNADKIKKFKKIEQILVKAGAVE